MSLTTKSLLELKDKSFDGLYDGGREKYAEMAHAAVNYAHQRGAATDKVLLGDVAELLKGSIEIHPSFLKHLRDRKLSPGSWALDFADYILEQVYPQPDPRRRQ